MRGCFRIFTVARNDVWGPLCARAAAAGPAQKDVDALLGARATLLDRAPPPLVGAAQKQRSGLGLLA